MKLLPNQSKLYPNTDRYKRLVGKMNYIVVDYSRNYNNSLYLILLRKVPQIIIFSMILRESLLYKSYFCIPLCNAS